MIAKADGPYYTKRYESQSLNKRRPCFGSGQAGSPSGTAYWIWIKVDPKAWPLALSVLSILLLPRKPDTKDLVFDVFELYILASLCSLNPIPLITNINSFSSFFSLSLYHNAITKRIRPIYRNRVIPMTEATITFPTRMRHKLTLITPLNLEFDIHYKKIVGYFKVP